MEAGLNTTPNMRPLIVAAVLVITLLSVPPTSAQHVEQEKAFAMVDEAHRAPLSELLNRLVEYERVQQWDKLYDLISAEYRRGRSKDDFVRETASLSYERIHIHDFSLKRTYLNDPPDGRYTFFGCATVYWKGVRQITDAHITVILEGGEWRIAEIGMFSSCLPPEMKCKEDG